MPIPSRLIPWLSWRFSLVLPIALIALGATFAYRMTTDEPSVIAFQVVDESGSPVWGAQVTTGSSSVITDEDGVADIPAAEVRGPIEVAIQSNGFDPLTQTIDPENENQQLHLTRVAAVTPAPLSDVTSSTVQSATPPPRPAIADQRVEGVVTNEDGKPIQGARVSDGTHLDITGKDGVFAFKAGVIDTQAALDVSASGYGSATVKSRAADQPLEVTLALHPIKAIYLNPGITTTEEDIDRLIEIIDTTETNAIVIDIKEELVFYDSQVPFFRDNGTVAPRYDIDALLRKFRDHDIYTIARLVVFKDSLIAEQNPDLAVINNQTGDVWRDMNGVAWVNPMNHSLWEANTDLALEAAEAGFNEIQYDYVRFPTDGDFSTMDFGLGRTQENREKSIEGFLKLSREKLLPTNTLVSADVFGYTLLVDDDLGIGQNFINLSAYVDYLSPMVYPSHFPEGSIDVPGHPNDYPYETIEISMRLGKEKLDGSALQIRPWLQDFDYFDLMPYGDAEVRAQIDAADKIGTSGWMLWDPNNVYHPGALEPEPAPEIDRNQEPVAVIPLATERRISGRIRPARRRPSGIPCQTPGSFAARN